MKDIEDHETNYKYEPGETNIKHRKYGPCSITDRFIWNGVNFYSIRVHGTLTMFQVTESQLIKEHNP